MDKITNIIINTMNQAASITFNLDESLLNQNNVVEYSLNQVQWIPFNNLDNGLSKQKLILTKLLLNATYQIQFRVNNEIESTISTFRTSIGSLRPVKVPYITLEEYQESVNPDWKFRVEIKDKDGQVIGEITDIEEVRKYFDPLAKNASNKINGYVLSSIQRCGGVSVEGNENGSSILPEYSIHAIKQAVIWLTRDWFIGARPDFERISSANVLNGTMGQSQGNFFFELIEKELSAEVKKLLRESGVVKFAEDPSITIRVSPAEYVNINGPQEIWGEKIFRKPTFGVNNEFPEDDELMTFGKINETIPTGVPVFKGFVANKEALRLIVNLRQGDIYYVLNEAKNYMFINYKVDEETPNTYYGWMIINSTSNSASIASLVINDGIYNPELGSNVADALDTLYIRTSQIATTDEELIPFFNDGTLGYDLINQPPVLTKPIGDFRNLILTFGNGDLTSSERTTLVLTSNNIEFNIEYEAPLVARIKFLDETTIQITQIANGMKLLGMKGQTDLIDLSAFGFSTDNIDNESNILSQQGTLTNALNDVDMRVINNTNQILLKANSSDLANYVLITDFNLYKDSQTLINDSKENISNKGVANGYAPLDSTSKVPLANLPTLPTPETGLITQLASGIFSNNTTAQNIPIMPTADHKWIMVLFFNDLGGQSSMIFPKVYLESARFILHNCDGGGNRFIQYTLSTTFLEKSNMVGGSTTNSVIVYGIT